MAILDDVCAQQHGVTEGADQNLKAKLNASCSRNQYFDTSGSGFIIHHYAGKVDQFSKASKYCYHTVWIFENFLLLRFYAKSFCVNRNDKTAKLISRKIQVAEKV